MEQNEITNSNRLSESLETEHFLKSPPPPATRFAPNIPPHLLEGKSESEKYLYEMVGITAKQNEYIIEEQTGMKKSHAELHENQKETNKRLTKTELSLEPFITFRNTWLTKKKMIRNMLVILFTAFLLPFLSILAEDFVKHVLNWK